MQITETTIDSEPQLTSRSILATVSLVCSLIFCCPLVTVFGPILGIIALIKIKRNPNLKGMKIALAGIIVGVITTIVSVSAISYAGKYFIGKMTESTQATIKAGFDEDYETFRNGLTSANSSISDEEIAIFITELRTRYGEFDSVVFNMDPGDQQLVKSRTEEVLPMRLVFEGTVVDAEVLVHFLPGEDGEFFNIQMHCILIFDAVDGDIIFPKGSDCDTSIQETEIGEVDSEVVDKEPVQ